VSVSRERNGAPFSAFAVDLSFDFPGILLDIGNIHANPEHTQHELEKLDEDDRAAVGSAGNAGKL
jgi:hypothetical protein